MWRQRPAGGRKGEQVAQQQLLADELAVVIGQQHRALPRFGALGGAAACTHQT